MKPEFEEASVQVQEILALYFWRAGDRRRVGIADYWEQTRGLEQDFHPETRSAGQSFLCSKTILQNTRTFFSSRILDELLEAN